MFTRIATVVRKAGPLVAQLVPLLKQAWPIVIAILAIVADKSGATDGTAVPAAGGAVIATLIATSERVRRLTAVAAVEAIAQPLRAFGEAPEDREVPVFTFSHDTRTGRHTATAVSLHGRKYDLRGGPVLYFDTVDPDGRPTAEYCDHYGVDFLDPDGLDDDEFDDLVEDEGEEDPHAISIPASVADDRDRLPYGGYKHAGPDLEAHREAQTGIV